MSTNEGPGPNPVQDAARQRRATLTTWEHAVLQCLAAGHSNAEIALRMGRSEKTVRNRLTALYMKLGVPNRTAGVGAWLQPQGGLGVTAEGER